MKEESIKEITAISRNSPEKTWELIARADHIARIEEANKWKTVASHWQRVAHNLAASEAKKIKEAELWKQRAIEAADQVYWDTGKTIGDWYKEEGIK